MEKEIFEIYTFNPDCFDQNGKDNQGKTFREWVKDFERDFHEQHGNYYALNLYTNYSTMEILQKSCGAAPFLSYGMDLTVGNVFDPIKDPYHNYEMAKYNASIVVYAIDSAFMNPNSKEWGMDEEKGIYPLTLLIDNKIPFCTLRLSAPYWDDSDDGDITEDLPIETLNLSYV